ncbi:copper transporter family protein [Nocardia vaccinii]|uniref:copper transporter family protein n=1 Tax=Nocardia vaccinii TaxID=1822 RepID=UPI00082F429C|nr:copper transporter family protein [Nocardia vaccinii]
MPNSQPTDLRELPPLTLIRERFETLTTHAVAGLPPGWEQMNAAMLARRLLDRHAPAGEVDAVWAQLIEHARTRDETAVLVCAGAGLPMLHTIAAKLCGHWIYRADTEAMVLVGFLEALAEVDVARPNVAYRLRWATFRRACIPVRERQRAPIPVDWYHDTAPTPENGEGVGSPPGHPDVLVQQAVAEGVLTAADAGLIIGTRLDHRPITAVAADTGIGYEGLAKRRRRAEQRLAAWLRERLSDAQSSTRVEIAALDHLTRHSNRPPEHQPAARVSRTRPRSRVLPMPKSATSADHTPPEEARRCA